MPTKQLNYIIIIFIITTNRHTHACIRSAHIDFVSLSVLRAEFALTKKTFKYKLFKNDFFSSFL